MIELKEIRRNFKSMYLLIFSIFIVVTLSFMIQGSSEIVTNINKEFYHKNETITFDSLGNEYEKLGKNLKSNNIENFRLNLEFPQEIDSDIESYSSIYQYFLVNKESIDIKDKDIIIPMPYSLYHDLKIGDKINIRDNELNIVGYSDLSTNDAFLINIETAKLLNLKVEYLELNLIDSLNDVEKNEYIDELSNELNSEVNSEVLYRSTFERTNAKISIVILISVLSMIFIYYYILSDRKKKYYIFKFSGMTRKQFFKMLISELIVTYLFSFILSLTLFSLVNSFILKRVFGILRYDLTISSILHVFFLFLLILLVFMSINISFYFKKSLVEGFKEDK